MTRERQADILHRLTGIPIARCRIALRVATRATLRPRWKQLELEEAPIPAAEVHAGFAKCREILMARQSSLEK